MSWFQSIMQMVFKEQQTISKSKEQTIIELAARNGYKLIKRNEPNRMLRFTNGETSVNVYVGTMTVTTELNHPKSGKTQLHRRNVSLQLLENLFKKPRTHTGRGYYKR